MKRENLRSFRTVWKTTGKKRQPGEIYLDAGGGRFLPADGIVGIFDMDTATVSPVTRNFLRRSERRGETVTVKAELPKTFILYDDGVRETVYFSPFSPKTVEGRGKK